MKSDRARLIKLIHVGRREVRMDDDTYRAIVAKIAKGKTSSADCSIPELERIIAHLRKAGFKVRTGPKTVKGTRPVDTDLESKKVRALWLFLHEIGAVKNPSEAALAAYVKRQAGVDALQWVSGRQVESVIESLKKWAMRYLPAHIEVLVMTASQYPMSTQERREINGAVNQARTRRTYDPSLHAYQTLHAFIDKSQQTSISSN